MIEYQEVKSSMIAAVGYDWDTDQIGVKFTNGKEYIYSDSDTHRVSPEFFDEMLKSDSIGKFYNANVKGKLGGTEVTGQQLPAAEKPAEKPAPIVEQFKQEMTMQETFATPEQAIETAQQQGTALATIVIKTTADRAAAGERLMQIATERKRRIDYFAPLKRLAKAAHDAICQKEHEALAPLSLADAQVRSALRLYDDAEERARKAEEARLREIERQRVEAEAKKASEDAAIIDAQIAASEGRHDEAELILSNPLPFAPEAPKGIVLEKQVPKTEGLGDRFTWDFTVDDLNKIPRHFLNIEPNRAAIVAVLKKQGEHHGIPGITAVKQRDYTTRTASRQKKSA